MFGAREACRMLVVRNCVQVAIFSDCRSLNISVLSSDLEPPWKVAQQTSMIFGLSPGISVFPEILYDVLRMNHRRRT